MLPSIGIIGDSIAGLTLALACREAGTGPVVVYPCERELPQCLHLTPNASRVLHALGMKAELTARALQPQWSLIRNGRSGTVLAQRPLGAFSEARYGAPDYLLDSGACRELLRSGAEGAGVTFAASTSLQALIPERGQLTLADGTTISHGALVGCDGAAGFTSRELGMSTAAKLEYRVWQGHAPKSAAASPLRTDVVSTWLGPNSYVMHHPVPASEKLFVQVFHGAPANRDPPAAAQPELTEFRHWRRELQMLLNAVTDWHCLTMPNINVAERWHIGRTVLLGEACHPLPPFLGQNVPVAMEDAWVLSRMLERWDDEPSAGLPDYVRFRRTRALRVHRHAIQHGADSTLDNGRQAFIRNMKLVLGSRFLPEILMARLDWLYGYDCVRGFE